MNLGTGLLAGMGLSAAATAPLVYAMLNPRSGLFCEVIWRGQAPAGVAQGYALTFDDGPLPDSTAPILDVLGELGAKATFFVIGARARQYPQLVKRMHDEGHLVANHSFDHSHFCMFGGSSYWQRQIQQTDNVIADITGRRPAFFRSPLGVKTWFVARAMGRGGHAMVTWSRRAVDGVRTTPQRIVGRLAPHTQAGDILLLHDGIDPHHQRDPRPTVEAIKPLVMGLRERGLEPVALDALTGRPAYQGASPPAIRP